MGNGPSNPKTCASIRKGAAGEDRERVTLGEILENCSREELENLLGDSILETLRNVLGERELHHDCLKCFVIYNRSCNEAFKCSAFCKVKAARIRNVRHFHDNCCSEPSEKGGGVRDPEPFGPTIAMPNFDDTTVVSDEYIGFALTQPDLFRKYYQKQLDKTNKLAYAMSRVESVIEPDPDEGTECAACDAGML